MKNIRMSFINLFVFCFVFGVFGLSIASAQKASFSLKSETLGETRKMIVHLPEAYDVKHKDGYSVIYMLDAGNDDALTAKTARELNKAGIMPRVIVVAIENIRRGYDFTPPYEMFGRGDDRKKGNADKFLAFIKTELIPETDKKFKTNGHKVFMGHSWGGAFATYLLSQSPDLFDGFFIFSPSILYRSTFEKSTATLFADINSKFGSDVKLPSFIYVSVGSKERARFRESYSGFVGYLKKNAPSKVKTKFEVTEGADHMENPEISIPIALRFGWKGDLE
jgi:predicted alpha/beta superfamily hydrolase